MSADLRLLCTVDDVKGRLMGIEFEAAYLHRPGAPASTPEPSEFALLVASYMHLDGVTSYFRDGSKRELDDEAMEVGTRPRTSARDAAATFFALEHRLAEVSEIMADPYAHIDASGRVKPSIVLAKCGSTPFAWRGTQENYQTRTALYSMVADQLTPFLVARAALTESGDVVSDEDGNAAFVRSSRADMDYQSLIRHQDPLADGTQRIEVRTQGPSYSHKMLALKMQMTDLVLRAWEREWGDEGTSVDSTKHKLEVHFLGGSVNANKALHGYDPEKRIEDLERRVAVSVDGSVSMMNAFELLDVYRDHIDKMVPLEERSAEDARTLEEWDRLAEQLQRDPSSTVGEIEWTTRKAYFDELEAHWKARRRTPFTYSAAKQLMSSVEVVTTDEAQRAQQDRRLRGLLSNNRLFTDEMLAEAETPTPDEGVQYQRAQVVDEVLSWPPEDRAGVWVSWNQASIVGSLRLPSQVILFADSVDARSFLHDVREKSYAAVGARERASVADPGAHQAAPDSPAQESPAQVPPRRSFHPEL
jgi:hypothetical protein